MMRYLVFLLLLSLVACTVYEGEGTPKAPSEFTIPLSTQEVPTESSSHIAFLRGSLLGSNRSLVVMNLETGSESRITNRGYVTSFSWTPDGQRIYFVWTPDANDREYDEPSHLYVTDLEGNNVEQVSDRLIAYAVLSPDGENLIYQEKVSVGVGANFIVPLDYYEEANFGRQLDFPHIASSGFVFSPDSRFIAYHYYTDRFEDEGMAIMRLDDEAVRIITNDDEADYPSSWSPDSKSILFSSNRRGLSDGIFALSDVYLLDIESLEFEMIMDERGAEVSAVWSPNMEEILYVLEDDGYLDLYIMDADGDNERQLTETERMDENFPEWQPIQGN
jgi:Tol biopolymer transport system component